jgi:hypothetical protein
MKINDRRRARVSKQTRVTPQDIADFFCIILLRSTIFIDTDLANIHSLSPNKTTQHAESSLV